MAATSDYRAPGQPLGGATLYSPLALYLARHNAAITNRLARGASLRECTQQLYHAEFANVGVPRPSSHGHGHHRH